MLAKFPFQEHNDESSIERSGCLYVHFVGAADFGDDDFDGHVVVVVDASREYIEPTGVPVEAHDIVKYLDAIFPPKKAQPILYRLSGV